MKARQNQAGRERDWKMRDSKFYPSQTLCIHTHPQPGKLNECASLSITVMTTKLRSIARQARRDRRTQGTKTLQHDTYHREGHSLGGPCVLEGKGDEGGRAGGTQTRTTTTIYSTDRLLTDRKANSEVMLHTGSQDLLYPSLMQIKYPLL